jgi:UDP-N-acetylmuramyl tripeptide synthase
MVRGDLVFEAKAALARAAGALSRRAGRGGGTSLPGRVLLRLEPRAIATLAADLPQGAAVISATNGKTTTAAMVARILGRRGTRLVHNRAGANMAGGVASALLQAPPGAQLGLFEVDEMWLGPLAAQLRPRALLLGNLFRDQLDRYGELEAIADAWAQVVRGSSAALVLNADDPAVADLGRDRAVTWFGVDDDRLALPALQHASDSKHCRRCGAPYVYDAVYLGHLGRYRCPTGDARRPDPDVRATDVALHGVRAASFTLHLPGAPPRRVELPLPGLYNVYNALGAAALALQLGAAPADVAAGLQEVEAAFGRAERIELAGRALSILLVKNPAGANEVLRTLALEPGPLDVLAVLNDNTADGRDVSWIWDADFELLAPRLRRATCSGRRAAELALRLKYAGADPAVLRVEPDLPRALDLAAADGEGPLYALPTYTALLALRQELAARGLARRYWDPAAPALPDATAPPEPAGVGA